MNVPVVAIVGRPNVGKSTLFNRIVGRREAIVDNRPGVTRDRKYAQADWAGRHFTLMDTGGYLPSNQDLIEKAVYHQVQAAIDEAHLIVFLVDVYAGVTAMDEELAKILKKSHRKVLLAVNKVDNAAREWNTAEFFKLGLGEPVSISALNSRNIGDFLDVMNSFLPEVDENQIAPSAAEIALAVVGRPNVGKSSFVNALTGRETMIVTEVPGTTRDAIDTRITYYGEPFLLIDTAGLRKKAKVKDAVEYYSTVRSFESIRRCDVAVIMIDATLGLEVQDLKILDEAVSLNKGVILAVNKWDLIEKDSKTAIAFERKIHDRLKSKDYLPIIFISALTKQRVYKVLNIAKSVDQERRKVVKTSELNVFLEAVTRKYAPPSMDRKEVKIKYCTQIKSNPPVIAFFTNAPTSIKSNYRAFLENHLRQQFGFFGVPLTLVFRKK